MPVALRLSTAHASNTSNGLESDLTPSIHRLAQADNIHIHPFMAPTCASFENAERRPPPPATRLDLRGFPLRWFPSSYLVKIQFLTFGQCPIRGGSCDYLGLETILLYPLVIYYPGTHCALGA
jgi:hypothetical protein